MDGSIANVLGWHHAYFWLFLSFGTPQQRAAWEAVFYMPLANGALDKAIGYAKDHGRAWLHSPASGSARRRDTS